MLNTPLQMLVVMVAGWVMPWYFNRHVADERAEADPLQPDSGRMPPFVH